MSEREDFNAWLKTWALPGNTSREDSMYAAWKARADRTAPAEGIAIGSLSREVGSERIVLDPIGDPHIKDGMVVYTAPDALQAEVGRLTECLKRANDGFEEFERKYCLAIEERDALRANAERYLWLRRKNRNNIVVRNGVSHLFDELLDRSIDAARTAKPEVKS